MKHFLILFLLISNLTFSQKEIKPFQGRLVYSIHVTDTSLIKFYPDQKMYVYTNDTIVRTENFSNQLGKQTVIKHTVFNKSILLLSANGKNFAIQTDLNKKDTTKKANNSNLTLKKLLFKRKIAGLKANRMKVSNSENKTSFEIWYVKTLNHKYIDAYPEIVGLPVKYYLSTPDAIFEYKLESIEYSPVNPDLFGVPSDYKRVNFDQFLEEVLNNK